MARRVICPVCEDVGPPKHKKRGSGRLHLLLWLAVGPLALLYGLWRMTTRFEVCRSCGSEMLIEEKSMVGQKLLAKMDEELVSSLVPKKKKEIPGVMPPERTSTILPRDRGAWRPEHDKDRF